MHYIPVKDMSRQRAVETMHQYVALINDKNDPEIINYVIPTREENPRIVCLNPIPIDPLDYHNIRLMMDDITGTVNDFFNANE